MRALRDYQLRFCDAVDEKWKLHRSTLGVLPTGCGKTVCFAEIIRRRQPGRSLVIAHRQELISQAKEKIESWAGLDCEIEMGDQVASANLFTGMPVVIATVQTLISGGARKRMERFNPMDFSTLVIDEFHHAPAASYRRALDYFLGGNPELKVLGVTATPDRADEEALGQVCESVAYDYQIIDAIHDGWLVPVEQQFVSIAGLDFSGVRTTAGDLNGADLAKVMEDEAALQGQCAATLGIIGNRQAIFFASSVCHAEMAREIFNRHRDGIADFVCGTTDLETRRKTMSAVVAGRTQILCNVGVATEGFDAPGIECIIMGRPTKSRALYAQMAGRATRPLPGTVDGPETADARKQAIADSRKKACLIVDFVGNSGRHKLMTTLDILGGKYTDEEKELAAEIIAREGGRRISDVLQEASEEIIERQRKEAEERRLRDEARRARLVAQVSFKAHSVNPFDAWGVSPTKSEWNPGGKALSEKQREMIRRQGIDPDSMSYRDAKNLLNEMFRRINENLCTPKMQALLVKHGYREDTPRDKAGKIIDAIKNNGWRRPVNDPFAEYVHKPEPAPKPDEWL